MGNTIWKPSTTIGLNRRMDIDVFIERLLDAFTFEEFLTVLLDDEKALRSCKRVFEEFCSKETEEEY